MANKLTVMQEYFLDALFGEAKGDVNKACKIAGYASGTERARILSSLRSEINDRTQHYLAAHGPKAAMALLSIMDGDVQSGDPKDILRAAEGVLDRGGVVKLQPVINLGEGVEGTVFIMPTKDPVKETDVETAED
jgi:hypothetical protein